MARVEFPSERTSPVLHFLCAVHDMHDIYVARPKSSWNLFVIVVIVRSNLRLIGYAFPSGETIEIALIILVVSCLVASASSKCFL